MLFTKIFLWTSAILCGLMAAIVVRIVCKEAYTMFRHRKKKKGPCIRTIGHFYWTIIGPLSKLTVRSYMDSGTDFDDKNWAIGNYFASERNAFYWVRAVQYLLASRNREESKEERQQYPDTDKEE